ncbi:hypothetical protein V501_01057 [Pseudogymnoascus sp. VKM F-4519 (FW-2642)]|nr:hypothetical protein V501_01057 [Pseudogymnoascus sp. VKM F-4519 (FW-2642)]
MPRSKARRSKADEDPKSRVSKYRKRLPSMYSKAEKFARDTDVQMMALLTVDKHGKCRSFAAGEQRSLVPIMREIREKYPSGNHKFLRKQKDSRFWRVVENDPSHASNGTEETEQSIIVGAEEDETWGATPSPPVTPLEEPDNLQLLEPNDANETSDALGELQNDSVEIPWEARDLSVGSARDPSDVGHDHMAADVADEPDTTASDNMLESNHTPMDLDEGPGASSGVTGMNTDTRVDECIVIDFDTAGMQGDLRADFSLLGESNGPQGSFQDDSSPPSGDDSSEIVTSPMSHPTRPRMDLRRLIADWAWAFRPHLNPLEPRPVIATGTA